MCAKMGSITRTTPPLRASVQRMMLNGQTMLLHVLKVGIMSVKQQKMIKHTQLRKFEDIA